jgi:hypothetical protein
VVHNLSRKEDGPVTAQPSSRAEQPHLAQWLGYSALCGWLAGPLLAAAYWLANGDADAGQLSFGPSAGLLPLAGLILVWAGFAWMTHGTLEIGWRSSARRAAAALAFGSVGWLLAQIVHLPTGESINELAAEWLALTLPYPLAAAAVQWLATRPAAVVAADGGGLAVAAGPNWTTRYRTHTIGVACLVILVLGLSIESVGSDQARAADIPVRAANAEPEAPAAMLLLVDAPRNYKPIAYSYVNDVATISYAGRDTSKAAIDDLEVIVARGGSASSPCKIDWASADFSAGSGDALACKRVADGRWQAIDKNGNTLYIGEHDGYDVALAVNAQADDPVPTSALPALLRTVHQADVGQRAMLNAEENTGP